MGDVENLREWMGRIESKVDDLVQGQATIAGQWSIRPCERHDARIRVLEQHRWASLGIVGVVASLPGVVALVKLFS